MVSFKIILWLFKAMPNSIETSVQKMRLNPKGIKFKELAKVCNHYFGLSHQTTGSHKIYRMPWQGDPRVNIQNSKGQAKAYQVKQVLLAIDKMEKRHDPR